MAKKSKGNKSKGAQKAGNHSKNLAAGMGSLSTSKTPISTLYPKKVTVGSSRTAPAFMNKGTRNVNKSTTPQKLLLSITNPGPRPTAPTNPGRPGLSPSTDVKGRLPGSVPSDAWLNRVDDHTREAGYNRETQTFTKSEEGTALRNQLTAAYKAHTTATNNFNTYLTSLRNYNLTTLPNWNTAHSEYISKTVKNNKKTSQYNKDIAKFISGLEGKTRVTAAKAKRAGGSRGSNRSKPGGSRN
tara:strand:+ start:275 stop:1000 length:726 start_codon:yes stop_codon:yes gene_type:complete